ncbi:MAG TPA: hypothetical protein VFA21_20695 [Pyrinomonadaceae bacterium]|nr:hypothetical protein [Pyrinomonadaceae bacterium]
MQKRARSWSSWLWMAIALAAVVAAVWVEALSKQPSGRANLKIEVASLRSQAAVGQLLAEQSAAGNLTSTFVAAQSSQILKNVDSTRARLRPSEFEPALREDVARAGDLSSRLSEDVRALEDAGGDGAKANALKQEFAELVSQLLTLEDSLKS